jgi:hypothetical protein
MPAEDRQYLREFYDDSIRRLEERLSRDLSDWK